MVSRRDVLALAAAAPALLTATRANGAPEAQAELEQHESVQAISSYEKTPTGVVFHCATSGRKNVDVILTACTPEILRVQMARCRAEGR